MVKIIKKISIIVVLLLFMISINVFANELTIECPDSIELGNTVECKIKGDFTDDINSIKVRYTLLEGIEFEGFTPIDKWNLEQGGTKETTGFVLRINEGNVTGQVEFGKFVFKVPSTYSKDTISLKLYDLDATNTSCEIVEFNSTEVIKDVKIAKKEDDKLDETGKDETTNPSDDKNETDDGKHEGNENIEDSKDDNNAEGNIATNNNNNNQSSSESDMNTNEGNKENINSDNINNNNNSNIDKTPSKAPFGQYGNGNITIILIVIVIVAIMGFMVYKKR